jgi:hypothetical protein
MTHQAPEVVPEFGERRDEACVLYVGRREPAVIGVLWPFFLINAIR